MAVNKRELINIIGPALRGLTAGGRNLAVMRFDDSEQGLSAKDQCDVRITLGPDDSTEQVISGLREQVSEPGPNSILVENLGVFRRADETAAQKTGRVAGKVAVVTGAAQGFGLEIAQDLIAEGAFVALTDVNIDGAVRHAKDLCRRFGRECL